MDAAEALVRTLVEERLIACGNLVPGVVSIYRWEGAIERDSEVLAILKTAETSVDALFQRIGALHPYAVPEIVEVDVGAVAGGYSDWVLESSKVNE